MSGNATRREKGRKGPILVMRYAQGTGKNRGRWLPSIASRHWSLADAVDGVRGHRAVYLHWGRYFITRVGERATLR
jgi:hypothetical protein